MIETALGKEHYYSFYDRARARGHLPDEWRNAVAGELQPFADQIREDSEITDQEARQYPFSYGKVRASHLE